MAADLAKLSLWLATLAKDHPFTFLDHSLRAGDSLVGLGRKQIASLHWDAKAQRTTVTKSLEDAIRRAAASRRDILEGGDFLSPALKAQKLDIADDALSKPRLIGDAVIAAFFAASKPKERQRILDRLAEPVEDFLTARGDYVAARAKIADLTNWLHGKPRDQAIAASADALAPADPISHPLAPFHWEIEFPEVFGRDNPGFDAIVGNPPFAGHVTLTESCHEHYTPYLRLVAPESGGKCDLVAFFFRRAFCLLNNRGTAGLIATNTIAQGDTRYSGLRWLATRGADIYSATRRLRWPGSAAVVVTVIHICRSRFAGQRFLDGRPASRISAYLSDSTFDDNPAALAASLNRTFQGVVIRGKGFLFDDDEPEATPLDEMRRLIAARPENAQIIRPYIGGEELNNSPTHSAHRFVIDFGEREERETLAWPELFGIVRTKVLSARSKSTAKTSTGKVLDKYWQFGHVAADMYRRISSRSRVLACSQVSPHLAFAMAGTNISLACTLVVTDVSTLAGFCVLQSRPHEWWARVFSSSMKDDLRYTPSDCFETFPFPENFETDARLEAVGKEYYEFRAALMVKNDEGLTKTYNRFHDPGEASTEIARLRELHAAMDRAVLDAYGWQDVQPVCGFALDWLDLDDDELADTLASAPDDIRERIESADYFFPDAASACHFQSHIKKDGKGKLPWRYRWPDDTRDDILARLLALNAARAELERLTGLSSATPSRRGPDSATAEGSDSTAAPPAKAKRAKKASKRATKKSAPRPMFDD
jgi:hypothetical protein